MLTTHLMEEADTLSDDLGIITEGKLRCFGTSNNLKRLFGGGYQLQIVLEKVHEETEQDLLYRIDQLTKNLSTQIPSIRLKNHFKNTLNYVIPGENVKLGNVFSLLKNSHSIQVADWSISQGSLEDVFINVVRKYRKCDDDVMEGI